MKCFNHNDIDSVGTCSDCFKGLCPNCAARFEIPACIPCNKNRISKEKSQIYLEFGVIIFSAIIAPIILNCMDGQHFSMLYIMDQHLFTVGKHSINMYHFN